MNIVLNKQTAEFLVVLITALSSQKEWGDGNGEKLLLEIEVPSVVKELLDGTLKPYAELIGTTQGDLETNFFEIMILQGLASYKQVYIGQERCNTILQKVEEAMEKREIFNA